jgi:hypothetical protein
MATKIKERQNLIHYYKEQTGKTEVDMKDVAKFAVDKLGWKLPVPESPLDRLAKTLSQAAREEYKYDGNTGKPYRVNHVISIKQGDENLHLWIDIDEAPRKNMLKSLVMRREQMVNDGLQLTYDADHWNNVNPSEDSIQMVMDFTEDINERKNAPDERKKAA